MGILQDYEKEKFSAELPELKTGATVRVHQKIKEGDKERVQVFEGMVIKISSGRGTNKNFTVRKVVSGIGVEKIFPFTTPSLAKVEVVKKSKVRRAKLYYLRSKLGKRFRLYDEKEGDKAALPKQK